LFEIFTIYFNTSLK